MGHIARSLDHLDTSNDHLCIVYSSLKILLILLNLQETRWPIFFEMIKFGFVPDPDFKKNS